ncbi:hypothetical protein HY546_03585 [archaeon]|nr:hypothetical protein [archaeon]
METEKAIEKLKAAEERLPVVNQCVSDLMNDAQEAAQLVIRLDYMHITGKEDEKKKLEELLAKIMFYCLRFSSRMNLKTGEKLEEEIAKQAG